MKINLQQAASVAGAPPEFWPAVQNCANYIERRFAAPVSVGMNVGWGDVGGSPLGGGALGSSIHFFFATHTYAQLRTAMQSRARSANAVAAAATLPVSDPTGGGGLNVHWPLAILLGLEPPTSSIIAFCGFKSGPTVWDFSHVDDTPVSIAAGRFDFFGVCYHEMSELLGRTRAGDAMPAPYLPLNLFSYSALNTRLFTTGGYFSFDNGATIQNTFAGTGDFGDWSGSGGGQSAALTACNAQGTQSVFTPVDPVDKIVIDILGWDQIAPAPAGVIPWRARATWSS